MACESSLLLDALSSLAPVFVTTFAHLSLTRSEGNLLLLNEALTKHETFFIRCGIFLILEKLKIITYRNLFKKV